MGNLSLDKKEGFLTKMPNDSYFVEACVASHCRRYGKTYYFKRTGEVDIIWLQQQHITAVEVKWAQQLRPADLKLLKQFKNSLILDKSSVSGQIEQIKKIPVHQFLYQHLD